MENSHESPTELTGEVKPRPVFLTVLCILSYVGNAFIIFGSLFSLVFFSAMKPVWEMAMQQGEVQEEMAEMPFPALFGNMVELMDYIPLMMIVALVAGILNLFGVFQMWKMKKSGFYVYSITELAPYIVNFVLYTQVLGAFGALISIFNLVIPVGFVIMYGLNLKHMR